MALNLTETNFQSEVIDSSVPVLVDFWAEWRGPCKMIGPVIDQVATDQAGTQTPAYAVIANGVPHQAIVDLDFRLEGEPFYVSGDVEADDRWPRWGAEVAPLGLRSVISVRLASQNRRYGSLNLYSPERDAWEDGDLEVATVFARHASVAVASA